MASIALSAASSAVTASLPAAGSLFAGTLIQTAGSFLGGVIDEAIFGSTGTVREGPRLAELSVQTSTYGKMIPVLYGSARVAGNIIWARDIKEVASSTTASAGGGKGGGGGSVTQTSVTYSYFATLAIALCEGPIDEVTRVWADAKIIDPAQSSVHYNVHTGSEDQLPDSIIESFEGVGNVPAYRGRAYVVIEDFPLAEFGNRIPNFTFEVRRKVLASNIGDEAPAEQLVTGMCMIPGGGEFVYDTLVQFKKNGSIIGGSFAQVGDKIAINQHNVSNKADALVSLDQLQATCPNVEWLAPVVTWFTDSIDAGDATVYPAVEFKTGGLTEPNEWSVAGQTRATAAEISKDANNKPNYGGTPDDSSVLRFLTEVQSRGLKVMFYPLMFVDKPDKPWRGRITGTPAEVTDFFTKTNGYNAFILHYANLVKDHIDAFVIGSELIGLTKIQAGDDSFPAVDALVNLAAQVKAIVGPSVKVTYAADWSEYHHTDGGWYNLDPLWASANIDMVGIDAYFPILDEPQQGYDVQKIIDGWTSGEGYDFVYDENHENPTPIAPEYAWKNLAWWWGNTHENPGGAPTSWVPESKKIWFTEYGFPSVDGAANRPNVFYDPGSSESSLPWFSQGKVDIRAQRQGITGTELMWKDSPMVEQKFVWTWDARPFSFWPDLSNVWSDGGTWKTGHWINGKFGLSGLAAIVEELSRKVGLSDGDFDVTRLTNLVEGYVLTSRISAREPVRTLRQAYFFDAVESDGLIKYIPRGEVCVASIAADSLVPQQGQGGVREVLEITRAQELELPQKVDVNYLSKTADYQLGNQHAQREIVETVNTRTLSLPIVLTDQEAKTIADISLYNNWVERTRFAFSLPMQFAALEPGDVITLTDASGAVHTIRLERGYIGKPGLLRFSGVAEDISAYDFLSPAGDTGLEPPVIEDAGKTTLTLFELAPTALNGDVENMLYAAVTGDSAAWNGAVLFCSNDGGISYSTLATADTATLTGIVTEALAALPHANAFDNGSLLTVILQQGELESVSELSLLNGANAALIGNEVVQFQYATLIGEQTYLLERLLRGRLGTEHAMAGHVAGEKFILLDAALLTITTPTSLLGLPRLYKPVTLGKTLGQTDAQSYTYSGAGLKPFSPVRITGTRDGAGELTLNWVRRTRIGGSWKDYVDAALGETTEAYEVDILDGSTVVRTLSGLSQPHATYTAAQQITDFGSVQPSLSVKIYQLSSVVGRGTAGAAIV